MTQVQVAEEEKQKRKEKSEKGCEFLLRVAVVVLCLPYLLRIPTSCENLAFDSNKLKCSDY